MMATQTCTRVVAAAAAGDAAALEQLVSDCLPLVYNIVGRALPVAADVDDVVQETMLRVVRGLPSLRDPLAFRSWLVAVTMNQVRDHVRGYQGRPRPLDEVLDVADPGADFADLTLTELGLTGQRREVAMATSWLDADDRELLALWWLVEAGHLTRGELVAAMRLDPHHVTVRIARMKAQLEVSRAVVRALCAVPICFELSELAMHWHGRPEAVWRKRFARHVRQCQTCAALAADFVPAERLLVRLALVPVPFGTADAVHRRVAGALYGGVHDGVQSSVQGGSEGGAPRSSGPHSHRRIPRGGARTGASHLAAKAAVALAATAAVVGAVVVATGIADNPKNEALSQGSADSGSSTTSAAEPVGSSSSAAQSSAVSSSSTSGASSTSGSKTSSSPAARPDPSRTSTTSKPSASSKPAGSSATGTSAPSTTASVIPPSTPPGTPPSSSSSTQVSPEDQVLAVINQARAAQGLPALTRTAGLDKSAAGHTNVMAGGCGLSHQCPGEPSLGDRETAAGVSWSAAGENIGDGGPVADTGDAIAKMAVGLTDSMLAERPPDDGHRRNILSSSFHHIGISIFRDSSGTVWMTQDFSD